ncbi:MAG: DUF6786 family protein [Bacteroidota bacterium]
MNQLILSGVFFLLLMTSCSEPPSATYQQDLDLLKRRTPIIELVGENPSARVLISPSFQGRVMTSTYGGLDGKPNGWFDRNKLAAGEGPYAGLGGEDRVWIGPLGSQFSFYYQQLEPLDEDNWLVPPAMETDPFELVSSTPTAMSVRGEMALTNFKGTKFKLRVDREVSLLDHDAIEKNLGISLPKQVASVAFRSENRLTNTGDEAWSKQTGLATLLSMGMYPGTDSTTVLIPLPDSVSLDDIFQYFAPLGQDRLSITDGILHLRTDGRLRSKIGIPRQLAPPVYGSYVADEQRLTIVRYRQTNDSLYFNSNATVQANPFHGEVIPVYNNGPLSDQVAPEASFYEMESAAALQGLAPGGSLWHFHEVYHFGGPKAELTKLVKAALGAELPN